MRFAHIERLSATPESPAANANITGTPEVAGAVTVLRPATDVYGIFSFPPAEQRWTALADLGVGWVRLQFRMVESDIDSYVRVITEGYALWLTIYPRDRTNVAESNLAAFDESVRGGFPPAAADRYQEQVRATVRILVEQLQFEGKAPGDWLLVQLGNEVLPSDVAPPQPVRFWHGTADEYLDTLALTFEAVKSIDAEIPVAAAGIYSLRLKADVIERLEFRIEQSLQGFPVRCVRLL